MCKPQQRMLPRTYWKVYECVNLNKGCYHVHIERPKRIVAENKKIVQVRFILYLCLEWFCRFYLRVLNDISFWHCDRSEVALCDRQDVNIHFLTHLLTHSLTHSLACLLACLVRNSFPWKREENVIRKVVSKAGWTLTKMVVRQDGLLTG